ncbi:MAG: lysostaphin resistance A-like protein [Prochloraceae cyanobacterium]
MHDRIEIQAKELFSKLKVRHIFLKLFLLLFGFIFALVNISGTIALIISIFNPAFGELFFEDDTFIEQLIDKNIFFLVAISYTFTFGVTCWLLLRTMKSNKIKIKPIIGKFSLKKRLWLSIFIVILANRILGYGVTQITLFCASLISQDFVKNALENTNESMIYNGDNFFLQFIYWLVFFTSLVSQDFVKNALESTNEFIIYNADYFFLQVIYWLLLFTITVIVAPITEEFIFRGAILHRWSTKWGIVAGILMSSFVFGLLHLNIFVITISIGGIIYALLYIKTGSLLVPIIAHALNNFLFFVNFFLRDTLSIPRSSEEITILSLWYGIVNICMAVPALIYFLKMPKNIAALPYFSNQKYRQKVKEEVSSY